MQWFGPWANLCFFFFSEKTLNPVCFVLFAESLATEIEKSEQWLRWWEARWIWSKRKVSVVSSASSETKDTCEFHFSFLISLLLAFSHFYQFNYLLFNISCEDLQILNLIVIRLVSSNPNWYCWTYISCLQLWWFLLLFCFDLCFSC